MIVAFSQILCYNIIPKEALLQNFLYPMNIPTCLQKGCKMTYLSLYMHTIPTCNFQENAKQNARQHSKLIQNFQSLWKEYR